MYDYLKGKITSKQLNSYRGTYIVVETNNIGYLISTNKRTIERIDETDKEYKIYVSLSHKEDSMTLTGFITKEERDIYNILQSVSGIGIKMALGILDEFSISELIEIMITEDFKELSRAKGIGAKVAQKIILELKDKLINWSNVTPIDVADINTNDVNQEAIIEVQSVLISLGYSANEAKDAIKQVISLRKEANSTEDILKFSLEILSKLS